MRKIALFFFIGPVLMVIGLCLPWIEYDGYSNKPEGPDWTNIVDTDNFPFMVPGLFLGVSLQALLIRGYLIERRIIKLIYWLVLVLSITLICGGIMFSASTAGFGAKYIRLSTGFRVICIGAVFSIMAGIFTFHRRSNADDMELA